MPTRHHLVAPAAMASATADKGSPEHGGGADNPAAGSSSPTVRTRSGEVRGLRERTRRGTVYFSFRGVPYGAPPTGEMRFMAPRPAEPWTGVRDATKPGPPSYQAFSIPPFGPASWSRREVVSFIKTVPTLLRVGVQLLSASEDSLFANVFTPQLPPTGRGKPEPMPVMVFIHGGGFRLGDGDFLYGPDYLMDAGGLVLVTFNYRLGPMGFLSVGTEAAPGNAGLKDQVLLLRWVRDNIAAFGGDPSQVTLAGESAGGVSVHLHMLSPQSRGLFHRAVASSSLAGSEWAHEENPLEHARQLAKHLGVEDSDPDAMVRRLRYLPARDIIRAFDSHMHHPFTPRLSLGMYFVPVVEPPHPGAFLTEDPLRMLADGKQAQMPLLTGHNSREGLLIFLGIGDGKLGAKPRRRQRALMRKCAKQRPEAFLPSDFHRGLDAADRDAVGREVLRHYFGEEGLGPDKFDEFIDLFGDTMFAIPVLRGSGAHAAGSTAPVYHYYFNHDGELGTFKATFKAHDYQGASHGDDLGYLFRSGSLAACHRRPRERDEQCRRNMVALWSSFVRTGVPTAAGSEGDAWTARSAQQLRFLDISDKLVMRTGAPYPRLLFWNDLYKKYLRVSLF